MTYGDPDGFGRYGILEETEEGLHCVECDGVFQHLGLHVAKVHGASAAAFRINHGLKRTRGLVASSIRAKLVANGQRIASSPAGAALAEARDPRRAAKIWREKGRPVSAEAAHERDARASVMGKSGRKGRVLTCEYCECDFCPLAGASRRRFCSRSCASKDQRQRRGAAGQRTKASSTPVETATGSR